MQYEDDFIIVRLTRRHGAFAGGEQIEVTRGDASDCYTLIKFRTQKPHQHQDC